MALYCLVHLEGVEGTTVGRTNDLAKALKFSEDNCPGKQCRKVYLMPREWRWPKYASALRFNIQMTLRLFNDIQEHGELKTSNELREDLQNKGFGKADTALIESLFTSLAKKPANIDAVEWARVKKACSRLRVLAKNRP